MLEFRTRFVYENSLKNMKRSVDLIKWTGVLLVAEKPSCRITTKVLKSEFQHCPRTDGCEE